MTRFRLFSGKYPVTGFWGQTAAEARLFGRNRACFHPVTCGRAAAVCTWLMLAVAGAAAAAQVADDIQTRIRGHLAAGEFAPALALANALPQPAARDPLLAAIAQAQACGGARNAALATAGGIQNDRLRTGALDQMAGSASSGTASGQGAAGGATLADFDTLIDLITSTIAPQSWDTVGGPGAIDSFPGGVCVDTSGLMRRAKLAAGGAELAELRDRVLQAGDNRDVRRESVWHGLLVGRAGLPPEDNRDVRRESGLRKVSLTRLERQVQLAWARGQPPSQTMRNLAGLHKIQYLFLYPDSRDIVIAGPAGAWAADQEGRQRHVASGEPVLQLDDLVVVLRNARYKGGRFACSITPRRENLAATQAYLNEAAKTPLKSAAQRDNWLAKIRTLMGRQDITVEGLEPQTRVARVIVEADYRMKLVGMGLEEGVLGVTSYLNSVTVPEGGAPPPMNVLRWWFTMDYEALRATPNRDAFELRGPGVQVLSENEMLTQRGERIHTGQSDELTEQFAHSFTKHFAELAAKYPIYADLRNVFDLALVAALIVAEDVPNQLDWPAIHFLDEKRYQVERGPAPTEVETVINHRMIGPKHVVAGVSGGVSADARPYVQKPAIAIDDYGVLHAGRTASVPRDLAADAWWWD